MIYFEYLKFSIGPYLVYILSNMLQRGLFHQGDIYSVNRDS